MTSMKELEERYDGKSLAEIEVDAATSREKHEAYRRKFVEALYYIRFKKRWKENEVFKNASFDTYLKNKFLISEDLFDKERQAYINFGEDADRYGPGCVNKVVHRVGMVNAKKLFDDVRRKSRPNAYKAIEQHLKIVRPPKKQNPPKRDLERELSDKNELIRAQQKEIEALQAQNERLKKTVREYKARLNEYEKIWKPRRPLDSEFFNNRVQVTPV